LCRRPTSVSTVFEIEVPRYRDGSWRAPLKYGELVAQHEDPRPVALLSLLQNTARIKEPRAALVQTRRTGPTSGCPVKIEEPVRACR
jgi:hypothetical protein